VEWLSFVHEGSVGRNSAICIATRYRTDGPGIESRWGHFSHPSIPTLGLTQPPMHGYRVSFTEVKRPGRGVEHPLPSGAEVKEREKLYLLPLWTLRLPFTVMRIVRITLV
jgi:hypothetical protein